MTDKSDRFIKELLLQIYEDELDSGRPVVVAKTEMSPTGFLHVVHADPVFPIRLAVEDLEWAAKSVVGKGRSLLARPRILDVVSKMLKLVPECAVTLTHRMEKTRVQSDINGYEIAANIYQDRANKSIHGLFEKVPPHIVSDGLGKLFTLQGESEFPLMDMEGIGYFGRVVEMVGATRPGPKAHNHLRRAAP